MKTKVTKVAAVTVFGTVLLIGSTAWAGLKLNWDVKTSSNWAEGFKAGARYSADSTQYIGCTIYAGASPLVRCEARDKLGTIKMCSSTDPQFRDVVGAMPDYGYVSFGFDSAGRCTSIGSINASYTLP